MGSLFRIFSNNSLRIRMASLVAVSFCAFPCSPLQATSSEIDHQYDINGQMTNILNPENINNPQSILDELGKLEETFACSLAPLEEARRFFVLFINEINFKYGMNLTIEDAFHISRETISNMKVSEEEKTSMLAAMQLLESGSIKEFKTNIEEQITAHLNVSARVCWPWEWKWFGLNKNKNFHQKKNRSIRQEEGVDLPSNVYIGAIELFAAPLIFILPFPGTQALAAGVAADGARRIFDGVEQLGEERRNNPNYAPPQPPFN